MLSINIELKATRITKYDIKKKYFNWLNNNNNITILKYGHHILNINMIEHYTEINNAK